MLIVLVLGAVFALIALSAVRFARMDTAREEREFATRQRKRALFEGVVTPRAAREAIADVLAREYAGERVRVTVERLPGAAPDAPPGE